MKKLFATLLIYGSICVSAQNSSGIVKYSMFLAYDEGFSNAQALKDLYNKAIQGAKRMSFTLEFNDEESLFKLDNILDGDSSEIIFAKSFTSADEIIYYSKNKKEFLTQSDSHIGQYLVEDNRQTEWIMTKESKIVGNYLCYKATATLIVENEIKKFTFPIVAWYCPTIALSFGPKGYSGLPGLILELQERNIIYGLQSIVFDKQQRTIEKPNKGKKVTLKEFEAILAQPFKE